MTAYNVLVGVVHVVEADSPDVAVAKLTTALHRAGFDTYTGRGGESIPDVFESEDDSPGTPLPTLLKHDELPAQDLRALLDYDWSAEERDYEANPDNRHVFLAIQRLSDWLDDYGLNVEPDIDPEMYQQVGSDDPDYDEAQQQEIERNPWTVVDEEGVEPGQQCPVLGRFASHDDASTFISTLPDAKSGRYGINGPVT